MGLISDTHGLLRPEAFDALRGSDVIIHAGDVGKPEIIEQLRTLAPVVAVRGSIDKGPWASELPLTAVAEAGSALIYPFMISRNWTSIRSQLSSAWWSVGTPISLAKLSGMASCT